MSRVAPIQPEPLDATPRLGMTPARRARVLAKSDGHCAYPECQEAAFLEIDHIIALALGGRDHEDNLQALCPAHHLRKTALDRKLIGKANRLRIKNGPKEQQPKAQPIRSRGFRSRWSGL